MGFQKGDPRINRNGRPKKDLALSTEIRKALEKRDVESNGEKIARYEAISDLLTQQALQGNLTAVNIILDRTEGKPVASTELDVRGKISLPQITLTSEFEDDEENEEDVDT